jgi:nitrite reductase (NO-forming)
MQRIIIAVVGLVVALGAVTYALAQDGTPAPGTAAACATPIAATPQVATPEPTAATPAAATPEACPTGGVTVSTAPTAVTIELVDIAFKPTDVEIAAGVPVEITLTNNGLALHNFDQPDLGINVNLGPGQSETVTVTAPAGDYDFLCNIPGHAAAGMVGTLHAK